MELECLGVDESVSTVLPPEVLVEELADLPIEVRVVVLTNSTGVHGDAVGESVAGSSTA